MNEFSLIFDFLAEGDAEVRGRSVQLPSREASLIAHVVNSSEATEEERTQAIMLMRDSEEAMLHFVQLMSRASAGGSAV
jgi:ferritin